MKLTKKNIEALQATGKRYAVFDKDVTGFAVRIGASGDKSFYLVYRAGKGRAATKRWLRLGTFPTMSVEQARNVAKQRAAQVALGEDPAELINEDKIAPTIQVAFTSFFEQHDTKVKNSTSAAYHRIAMQYIFPAMGNIKVGAVQYRHVASLHYVMKDTPSKRIEWRLCYQSFLAGAKKTDIEIVEVILLLALRSMKKKNARSSWGGKNWKHWGMPSL